VSAGNASVRIVADTNTVLSGLLWSGPPQQLIHAAREERIELCMLAARADAIVSGDKRLRNLKTYQAIPIHGAAEALALIARRAPSK